MDWITNPELWVALLSLTLLEIVLGIDNIVFISVLSSKLPAEEQGKARVIGLILALFGRVVLLLSISWVLGLTAPLFSALGREVSGRDIVLMLGGLFLIGKATHEIHVSMEGVEEKHGAKTSVSFRSVIVQILLLDLVFSLDSVITAVGMVEDVRVMIAAVVIAMVFMIVASKSVSDFIHKHPTVKMLALSFLILVGVALMAESFHVHLPRGYVYSAMGFSIFVEMLNLRFAAKRKAA